MLSRAQGRPRPPSAAQDAPTRARGGLQALPDGAASTATPCRAPSGPPLYAGSGDMTRVRRSCRVFGAQDGVATPVQWGKTPSRGANPRPEDHDGHVHNEASPAQGCRARRWRAPPHGRHGWDRQARAGPAAPTSSRRFRRHRDENPAPGQHDMSGVPTARSVSQDAGFPRHCNENPVSDHHRMSGDEPRTNRLQHRGNTAIPGKPDLKPTQSVQ